MKEPLAPAVAEEFVCVTKSANGAEASVQNPWPSGGYKACPKGYARWRWASPSRNPVATASEGSAAIEETFQTAMRPLFSSNRQMSVKVPPESTPIRHAIYPYHPLLVMRCHNYEA